jgi:hypothetical protein
MTDRRAARLLTVERARPHLRGMLHALALYADEAESWAKVYSRFSPARACALRLRVDAAEYVMGLRGELSPLARDVLRNEASYSSSFYLPDSARRETVAP